MASTATVYPLELANVQHAHRVKKISLGLGVTLFVLSLALPGYIIKTTVTKEPTYSIVKRNVTTSEVQSMRVANPSFDQYGYLLSTYPETVNCECSQLSISYDSFLELQFQFHPVCSSMFVTQQWIDALVPKNQAPSSNDFHNIASYLFQTLSTLCQHSSQTMNQSLMEFLFDEYINTDLNPGALFISSIEQRIEKFKSTTIKNFLLSFSMIRGMIQNSALFSSLQSNFKLYAYNNDIFGSPVTYDEDCNCAHSTSCFTQAYFYTSSGTIGAPIPGFYTGCYVIDALLRSDLRCFYDVTCLNLLQRYIPSLSSLPGGSINLPLSTTYQPNTTIENILNNLMIESVTSKVSYINYYDLCAPSYCTYSVQTMETMETVELIKDKTDVAAIIGLVIGIIGGIIAILHLIVPRLVKLIIGAN
ncbi:unnamed protein product [Adineta ricciae]|uniref:Uncharacterized protein n=1 Tax=Adineta ricciae TaxID=249248 RepID=A0A816CQR8_ADIRI|nr:unnamed protein product [Adineta ricciae]CAF1624955.1 unnamed protein product [Adineta ricciae]